MYRVFYPTSGYTFLSVVHGNFYKIDHIVISKVCLSKCKRIEVTLSILSTHSAKKLEINGKETTEIKQAYGK